MSQPESPFKRRASIRPDTEPDVPTPQHSVVASSSADDAPAPVFPSFQRRKSAWDTQSQEGEKPAAPFVRKAAYGRRLSNAANNPPPLELVNQAIESPIVDELNDSSDAFTSQNAINNPISEDSKAEKAKATDADISKVIKDLKTGRLQAAARFNSDNMSPFARLMANKLRDTEGNLGKSNDSLLPNSLSKLDKQSSGSVFGSRDADLNGSKAKIDANGSAFSLSSLTQEEATVTIQPDGSSLLTCFPRSSSGLFNLKSGIEFQSFKEPYTEWRGAIIAALEKQVDYPLIVPTLIKGLASENFLS